MILASDYQDLSPGLIFENSTIWPKLLILRLGSFCLYNMTTKQSFQFYTFLNLQIELVKFQKLFNFLFFRRLWDDSANRATPVRTTVRKCFRPEAVSEIQNSEDPGLPWHEGRIPGYEFFFWVPRPVMDCGTAQVTATTKTKSVVYYDLVFGKPRVVSVPSVIKTLGLHQR